MSDNPFRSPESNQPYVGAAVVPSQSKTPGALTFILICSLILGVMGTLSSCMGGVALVFGKTFREAIQQQAQGNPDDDFAKTQLKIQEVSDQYMIPNIILVFANFLVAPMLLMGAIGGLNRKPWAYRLLSFSFLIAIIYVVLRAVFQIFLQVQLKDLTGEGVAAAMKGQNAEGIPPEAGEMMGMIASGMFWVTVVFTIAWALALVVFYLWSYFYVRRFSE